VIYRTVSDGPLTSIVLGARSHGVLLSRRGIDVSRLLTQVRDTLERLILPFIPLAQPDCRTPARVRSDISAAALPSLSAGITMPLQSGSMEPCAHGRPMDAAGDASTSTLIG
jgi:hypothetical protein